MPQEEVASLDAADGRRAVGGDAVGEGRVEGGGSEEAGEGWRHTQMSGQDVGLDARLSE